jgi:hypothetical protein
VTNARTLREESSRDGAQDASWECCSIRTAISRGTVGSTPELFERVVVSEIFEKRLQGTRVPVKTGVPPTISGSTVTRLLELCERQSALSVSLSGRTPIVRREITRHRDATEEPALAVEDVHMTRREERQSTR